MNLAEALRPLEPEALDLLENDYPERSGKERGHHEKPGAVKHMVEGEDLHERGQ